MRFLKTNTATRITVGPFLDVTDAKTPEVALTATNEKLTLMVDDAGVPTLVLDTTATASGGANDFVHITGDDAGYYDLELAAANVNYVGRATLAITYATDHLPVFHEFMILSASAYDALFGSTLLTVNATQVGGTAQTGRDLGASVLLSSGTGTGQISLSSGAVLLQATQTGVTIPTVTTVTNLTNAPTSGDLTATMKTSVTTAATAATPTAAAVTGNVGGNVTGSVGSVATGGITAASIADGAIDAATFAADVWTRLGIVAYGTAQAVTGTTIQLASASAFSDDELIGAVVVITGGTTGVGQSRMITDYVSSTDTATVDTWTTTPTGTITYVVFAAAPASATSLPAVNVTQISGDATAADNLEAAADGTGYNLGGGSVVAASVTGNVGGNVTGSVGSVATGGITAASIATGAIDADALAADAVTEIWAGSTAPAASAIADAVWDEALSGHSTAGSAGLALSTASSGGVDPSVLADAIWDEALSGHATAGTSGKALSDVLVDTAEIGTAGAGLTALGDTRIANLDATVSSRLAPAGTLATVTNLTNAPTSGDLTATMKASVTTAATAATPTAAAVTASVTLAADAISASALSAAAVDEILDEQIGDGTVTVRQALRVLVAGMAGKVSGAATTTVTIRNLADSANVIVATVDSEGNRSATTVTP